VNIILQYTFKALQVMYGTYEGVTLSGNPSGTTYDLMNAIISCSHIPQSLSFSVAMDGMSFNISNAT